MEMLGRVKEKHGKVNTLSRISREKARCRRGKTTVR